MATVIKFPAERIVRRETKPTVFTRLNGKWVRRQSVEIIPFRVLAGRIRLNEPDAQEWLDWVPEFDAPWRA